MENEMLEVFDKLEDRLAPMLALYERQVEAQERTAAALGALTTIGQAFMREFLRAMLAKMDKEEAGPEQGPLRMHVRE